MFGTIPDGVIFLITVLLLIRLLRECLHLIDDVRGTFAGKHNRRLDAHRTSHRHRRVSSEQMPESF